MSNILRKTITAQKISFHNILSVNLIKKVGIIELSVKYKTDLITSRCYNITSDMSYIPYTKVRSDIKNINIQYIGVHKQCILSDINFLKEWTTNGVIQLSNRHYTEITDLNKLETKIRFNDVIFKFIE